MSAADNLNPRQFSTLFPGIPVESPPPLPPGRSPHVESPYIYPVYPPRPR